MTNHKRLFSVPLAALAVVVASLALFAGRNERADVRMLAFSAEFKETAVLEALARAGIDDVVSATTTLVPLSDFSRVVPVPFLNADKRAPVDDPRRTPLLDQLAGRFTVAGPDAEPWLVVYLHSPDSAMEERAARVLSGFGAAWAWDAPARGQAPRFLWLPAALWALWLMIKKPRRGWPGRLLAAVSLLPLLARPTTAAALLFLALVAAAAVAERFVASKAPRKAFWVLWPYAAATVALVVLDAGVAPYLAVSVALFCAQRYLLPRLERRVRRARLHQPPVFRTLTLNAAYGNAGGTLRALAVPFVAVLALSALAQARPGSGPSYAPAFSLERAEAGDGIDAARLLREHTAYQLAVTYGRMGDIAWGDDSYAPAYRYREKNGHVERVADSETVEPDWPSDTFKAAMLALSGPGPGSIVRIVDKNPPKVESALP